MRRVVSLLWLGLTAFALCVVPRVARAEAPGSKAVPIYVLSIWTNDVDDQADALTQALRARVRQAAGWSLAESSQSFETLAIALRCPPTPNPACLERIGDQLHTDRYIWGTMARDKPGEVTADVRLWARGKLDVEASETYAESIKDPGDETLRGVAGRLFAKVTGGGGAGTVVVHAGSGGGSVAVDGVDKGSLDGGVAKLDLAAGTHTVTVKAGGGQAVERTVNVKPGAEVSLDFLAAGGGESETAGESGESKGGFPLRKVLGYTAIVAGAGLIAGAAVEGVAWVNDKSASDDDRKNVPSNVTDVCADGVNTAAVDACNKSKDATSVATIGWILGGAGVVLAVTGLWLVLGDHGSDEAPAASTAGRRWDVVPSVGPGAGRLDLRLAF
ncbi:MAG TPA: PEGA domain-containing protein [Polyangiaceae bacterium]|nr:PEGA domain-containing protein [Polyangiaceae bacterium]